jgi:5,10-methenyltetrahydromethanopterin hydrogenase
MAVTTGLMVGGALLAAGAVYAGWSARDTRKRIESLLKIARFMKKKGVAPLNVALNSNPETIVPTDRHDMIASTGKDVSDDNSNRGDIYIFKGKRGMGFQSRAAKLLNKLSLPVPEYKKAQKDASVVLKAMAKDLKSAGFNVLEEETAPLQLLNTRDALVRLSPAIRNIFIMLLKELAREHGFEINLSL